MPPWRLRDWLKNDREVYQAYSSLKQKAENGSLRSGNELLSVSDLSMYVSISSYFAEYPKPEYGFMALSQIPTVLKDCDANGSCAPLLRARSESSRLIDSSNAILSKIINCNELNDVASCQAESDERYRYSPAIAPISMIDQSRAKRIQSDLLILKSNDDLAAETPSRIDLFIKRVGSSRKMVVYFPTTAHSLFAEEPGEVTKRITEFWNQ